MRWEVEITTSEYLTPEEMVKRVQEKVPTATQVRLDSFYLEHSGWGTVPIHCTYRLGFEA